MADVAVEEGVIEERRARAHRVDHRVRRHGRPRGHGAPARHGHGAAGEFRVADVMEVVLLNGYSRLPVVRRGHRRRRRHRLRQGPDAGRARRRGGPCRWLELVRPARFVPETKRVPELLREMQRRASSTWRSSSTSTAARPGWSRSRTSSRSWSARSSTSSTCEDPMVEPLPGGGVRVNARMPIDEVNELLDADLPEGDWDTVGGLLYDRLGHVPVEGESVDVRRAGGSPRSGSRAAASAGSRSCRSTGRTRPPEPARAPRARWSGEGQRERLEAERAVVGSPPLAGRTGCALVTVPVVTSSPAPRAGAPGCSEITRARWPSASAGLSITLAPAPRSTRSPSRHSVASNSASVDAIASRFVASIRTGVPTARRRGTPPRRCSRRCRTAIPDRGTARPRSRAPSTRRPPAPRPGRRSRAPGRGARTRPRARCGAAPTTGAPRTRRRPTRATTVLSQTSAQNARSTPNASQSVRFVKPIFRPARRQPLASRRRPIAARTA